MYIKYIMNELQGAATASVKRFLESEYIVEFTKEIKFDLKNLGYLYFAYKSAPGVATVNGDRSIPSNPHIQTKIQDIIQVLMYLYMVKSRMQDGLNVQAWKRLLLATDILVSDLGPSMDELEDDQNLVVQLNIYVTPLSRTALKFRLELPVLTDREKFELQQEVSPRVFAYYNGPILLPHLTTETSVCLRCLAPEA